MESESHLRSFLDLEFSVFATTIGSTIDLVKKFGSF